MLAASAAGSVTYTLPSADAGASGYALTSNGSGTLSWTAVGASTASDDTTTNSTYYPTFSTATSGIVTAGVKVSSSKLTYNPSTGTLTSTVLTASSDERLKENIETIRNALEKVVSLRGVTYNANQVAETFGYTDKQKQVGVLAADVQKVLPEAVTTRDNGYKAVKYEKLVALLIEGIKEQQTQIHSLILEVENLKKQKGL